MEENWTSEDAALRTYYSLLGTEVDLPRFTPFDAHYYLSQNPDVASSGADPELHYVLWGRFEGRSPAPGLNSAATDRAEKAATNRYRLRNLLRKCYLTFAPLCSLLGLLLLFGTKKYLWQGKNRIIAEIFSFALLTLLVRAMLLAFFHATSFPAFGGYFFPGWAMYSLFSAVALCWLLERLVAAFFWGVEKSQVSKHSGQNVARQP
ncbi:MAG TPA: hypothetical protein PLP17_15965 [Oligoflexia bacterium]|nr:hypothetical protein [Oligoflexia bacterium]